MEEKAYRQVSGREPTPPAALREQRVLCNLDLITSRQTAKSP